MTDKTPLPQEKQEATGLGPAAVLCQGVGVSYGSTRALIDVDLKIQAGSVFGFLGVNGSGKTSLFKALVGLTPHSGTIRIFGRSSAEARAKHLIAYVPQNESLAPQFPVTVRDVVEMGLHAQRDFFGRLPQGAASRVEAALERTGISSLASRGITEVSGGQRKRAFVARALAQGATLTLLDEPFGGVDLGTQQSLSTLFRELASEGMTLIVSTHDLGDAPALCDEAVLLARKVIGQGNPAKLLSPEILQSVFGLNSPGKHNERDASEGSQRGQERA